MSDSQAGLRRRAAVKYPLELKTLALFAFLLLLSLRNLLEAEHKDAVFYGFGSLAAICLFGFIYLFARRAGGRAELTIRYGSVEVNGLPLTPSEIRDIRMDGPIVGIVPRGRRVPPVRLCLDIRDANDRKALILWAAQHNVPVRKGRFMRWL
ncbi:hypothetical protein [Cohnella laeviribosi]|uniref:hypothetical protein n=1 Tax=Cohnella laeviribosi TaxID=380174 RepID=UPI00037F25E9|nr:hypothetical protein [Cohnella laeviribosi]